MQLKRIDWLSKKPGSAEGLMNGETLFFYYQDDEHSDRYNMIAQPEGGKLYTYASEKACKDGAINILKKYIARFLYLQPHERAEFGLPPATFEEQDNLSTQIQDTSF